MTTFTFTNTPAFMSAEDRYNAAQEIRNEMLQDAEANAAAFVQEVEAARTARQEFVVIGGTKFRFAGWDRELENSQVAANAQNYTVIGRALYWLNDIELVREFDKVVTHKGLTQKVHCYLLRSGKGDRVVTRVTQRCVRKDGTFFDVQRWIALEQIKGEWVQSKSSRHYAHKMFEQEGNPFHAESIWSVAARILAGMSITIKGGNPDTAVKMIQAAYKEAQEYNG